MIKLSHGAGGRLTHELIEKHFLPCFDNPALRQLGDAAVLEELALTTDSYVVTPRFFPGGDLGRLAVSGTVNDLAMVGAVPLALSAGFILEEGLYIDELDRLIHSMASTAREADVPIVAGDTKVVPKGAADGIFVTTTGLGRISPSFAPSPSKVKVGDVVIVSGTLGDHGIAVITCREGLDLRGDLKSDVAPLVDLVRNLREASIPVHALRDPTRGGVAQSLLEIAQFAAVKIVIEEIRLPIRPAVRSACELLGFDPLHVANEGKLLAFVPEEAADSAVRRMREHPLGVDASIIGEVVPGRSRLEMVTTIGTRRIVPMPEGELLPRIC